MYPKTGGSASGHHEWVTGCGFLADDRAVSVGTCSMYSLCDMYFFF
jgi:hypothetical protein